MLDAVRCSTASIVYRCPAASVVALLLEAVRGTMIDSAAMHIILFVVPVAPSSTAQSLAVSPNLMGMILRVLRRPHEAPRLLFFCSSHLFRTRSRRDLTSPH